MFDEDGASQPGEAEVQPGTSKVAQLRRSIAVIIQELDAIGEDIAAAHAQMALDALSQESA